MRTSTFALSVAAAFFLLLEPAYAAKTVIKLGHFMAETHPQHVALTEYFKKTVEEKTNGRYEVRIFPNNQLGGEDQVLNGVRRGSIEAGVIGLLMQNVDPVFGVWEWPFLFNDNQEARKILTGSGVAKELNEKYEKYGIKVLATGMNGFRVVSSNKKVSRFSEFDGLRLRVPLNNIFVLWGMAMKASPQSMPLSEVFTALEQKVIDGQENPYALLKESGLYEVQKYVIETNHAFSPGILMFSLKTWNKMTPEDQTVLLKAAALFQEKQWELAMQTEEESKAFLRDHGLEIIVPDDSFKADMKAAVQPVYEDFYKKWNWAKPLVEKINSEK